MSGFGGITSDLAGRVSTDFGREEFAIATEPAILKRSEDLAQCGAAAGAVVSAVAADDDMFSCASDDEDFYSSFGDEVVADCNLFAAIGADTAENGPDKVGVPRGGVSPQVHVSSADRGGTAPPDAGGAGDRFPRVIAAIRERFGLSQSHARLLTTAAAGCPDADTNESPGRAPPQSTDRVRGVFPLPYLPAERATPGAPLRAGARRRYVGRCRAVSKTNLVVGLLNLLFGGRDCMAAALETRTGAAQLAALSRVQRSAQGWDFSADVSAAEELAGQPLVGYALDQELHAAVDTVPDLVKLPTCVGAATAKGDLPKARYTHKGECPNWPN